MPTKSPPGGDAKVFARFEMLERTNHSGATIAATVETSVRPFNHFGTMLLFAFFISMAFAALGQRRGMERFRYAVWSFALFILVGVGIAWLMYPISH
jgi:hypothetical protein